MNLYLTNIDTLKFKKLRSMARKLSIKNYCVMTEDELKEKLSEISLSGMNNDLQYNYR